MRQEIEKLLLDPDYDQSQLQDLFRARLGETWSFFWQRYLETGQVPDFNKERS